MATPAPAPTTDHAANLATGLRELAAVIDQSPKVAAIAAAAFPMTRLGGVFVLPDDTTDGDVPGLLDAFEEAATEAGAVVERRDTTSYLILQARFAGALTFEVFTDRDYVEDGDGS